MRSREMAESLVCEAGCQQGRHSHPVRRTDSQFLACERHCAREARALAHPRRKNPRRWARSPPLLAARFVVAHVHDPSSTTDRS